MTIENFQRYLADLLRHDADNVQAVELDDSVDPLELVVRTYTEDCFRIIVEWEE